MGRLIDADELKAVIDGYDYSEEGYAERIDFEFLYEVIDKQPTAYDLETVVQQLEEIKMRYFLTIANTGDEKMDFAYKEVGNAIDKAIEIVRNGGVK